MNEHKPDGYNTKENNQPDNNNLTVKVVENSTDAQGGASGGAQGMRDVLSKIKSDEVRMKPKAYFTLKAVGLVVVATLTLIVSALVLSYLIFSIRVSGHFFLLGFGKEGWYAFLTLFPWTALILDLILLIALDRLLQQFRFGYRIPLIYLGIGTLAFTFSFGILINDTPLHGMLMERAEQERLPVIGGFYRELRESPPSEGIFVGTVEEVQGNSLILEIGPMKWDVFPESSPHTVQIMQTLKTGDELFVAGTTTGDVIHAYGVEKMVGN
jgi:hypothetical protein